VPGVPSRTERPLLRASSISTKDRCHASPSLR